MIDETVDTSFIAALSQLIVTYGYVMSGVL